MFKRLELQLPFVGASAGLGGMGVPDAPRSPPHAPTATPRPHLTDLTRLPLRDRDGALNLVVEAPTGSRLALRYDARLGAFTIARRPVLGLAYPFDSGFLPSTATGDGQPLKCMALADSASHPGVVLPCRAIGVARYGADGGATSDRVLAVPVESIRWAALRDARKMPDGVREPMEAFFAWSALVEDKGLRFLGWDGPRAADRLIRESSAPFAR